LTEKTNIKKGPGMKLLKEKIPLSVSALVLSAALTVVSSSSAQAAEGWNISNGSSGEITAMTIANPKTYLSIEQSISIRLNNEGTAQGGTVKFFGGVERELTAAEATYYFGALDGPHTFWSELESRGKLATIDAKAGPIPAQNFGKMTRVVTTTEKELIGKLERLSDDPNGFSLVIDGACCGAIRFERGAVSQMQQIK
jgi:hypothetical protein